MLRPLGHRVIVRPDEQPDTTASGLLLPQDRDHVPVSGTVVAVGRGSARLARAREAIVRDCLRVVRTTTNGPTLDALIAYARQAAPDDGGGLRVGDRVAFPVEVGLTMDVDGQSYLVLNEDDVVVLVEDEAPATAEAATEEAYV